MKSLRIFDRRAGSVGTAVALLLGILIPGLVPMAVSAATLSARSVDMSSSSFGDSGVTYTISFTTSSAAKGFVVDFCNETPFSGDACTVPTGLDVSGGSVTVPTNGVGTVTSTGTSAGHLKVQGSASQSSAGATQIKVTSVHNPSAAGVIYARIYTYTGTIDYTNVTTPGTVADFGGVAMDITEAIGVTAAVREKLIFCVSHSAPTATCGGTDTPAIQLGEGTPKALDSSHVSTGDDYTQISTNAVGGAVVHMSNLSATNTCGGLHRAGASASTCDIAPRNTIAAITQGNAFFGMLLGTPTVLSGGSGTAVPTTNYAGTSGNYGMVYDNTNATGVTGPYGDVIYDTASHPANNVNVPMTFGASVSNDTPAGLYSATVNLVATGTF